VYLDKTIFCEGQAYVALSRVRNAESVHILSFDKCAFKTNMEIVDLLNYAKNNKTMKNYKSIFRKEINPIVMEDNFSHFETNTDIVKVRNYLN
jgi:hypothetical protein